MTSKKILMMLPVIFSLLLISNVMTVYGNHDDDDDGGDTGGGAGCSGDCIPPTLGIDNAGKVLVNGGFSINNEIFDVEHYKQQMESQIVKSGEPVEITLKVYENSGPDYLKHVGLMLGIEEYFQYVKIKSHPVEIHWEQTFDGIESIEVNNTKNLVSNVDVEVSVEDQLTILKFNFIPTKSFDTSTIIVQMWDQNRSLWTNYFYDALEIAQPEISKSIVSVHAKSNKTHEDVSDKTHEDVSDKTHELYCRVGFALISDHRYDNPVCVHANIASALVKSGWASYTQ